MATESRAVPVAGLLRLAWVMSTSIVLVCPLHTHLGPPSSGLEVWIELLSL